MRLRQIHHVEVVAMHAIWWVVPTKHGQGATDSRDGLGEERNQLFGTPKGNCREGRSDAPQWG